MKTYAHNFNTTSATQLEPNGHSIADIKVEENPLVSGSAELIGEGGGPEKVPMPKNASMYDVTTSQENNDFLNNLIRKRWSLSRRLRTEARSTQAAS